MKITIDHDWLGYPPLRPAPLEDRVYRGGCGGWHHSRRVCTTCLMLARVLTRKTDAIL